MVNFDGRPINLSNGIKDMQVAAPKANGAIRPPDCEDLDRIRTETIRIRETLESIFQDFKSSFLSATAVSNKKYDDRTLHYKRQVVESVENDLRRASNIAEYKVLLAEWAQADSETVGLTAHFEKFEDFQTRVLSGYLVSDSAPQTRRDSYNENYDMLLRSLSELFLYLETNREPITSALTKHCNQEVAKRDVLEESVEVSSHEEVIEGSGNSLGKLLEDRKQTFSDAMRVGGRIAMYGLQLPIIGGLAALKCLGQAIPQLKHLYDSLAARLGLNEALRKAQDALEEFDSEGARAAFRDFGLHLRFKPFNPFRNLPNLDNSAQQNEEPVGRQGPGRRRSQLGIRPVYERDEADFADVGNGCGDVDSLRGQYGKLGIQHATNIRTESSLFGQSLHNVNTWVVTGKDGSLVRLEVFLRECEQNPHVEEPPTFQELFPRKQLPTLENPGNKLLGFTEAEITARIYPGALLTLPLSPNYTAKELVFLDRKKRPLSSPQGAEVREGAFGSLKVRSPLNARYVVYTVGPKPESEKVLSEEVIHKLNACLPKFSFYLDPEEHIFRKALSMFPDPSERARLWFHAQKTAGFIYTMDPFLTRYQRQAGSGRAEAIAGTRMGICDSFAFHIAINATSLGVPALVLSGPVQKGEHFQFNPGHAVACIATEGGAYEFDLTKSAFDDSEVSRWNIKGGEKRALQKQLKNPSLTSKGIFESSQRLHYLLQGEALPWENNNREKPFSPFGKALSIFDHARQSPMPVSPPQNGSSPRPDDATSTKFIAVRALTQKWYLAELFRQVQEEQSLTRFLWYGDNRRTWAGPSEGELDILPKRFKSLQGFSGKGEFLRYIKLVITAEESSDSLRQEAIGWVLKESHPHGGLGYSGADGWQCDLSPYQLSSFFSEQIIAQFSGEQRIGLIDNLRKNLNKTITANVAFSDTITWSVHTGVAYKLETAKSPQGEMALQVLNSAFSTGISAIKDCGVRISSERALTFGSCAILTAKILEAQTGSAAAQKPSLSTLTSSLDALEKASAMVPGQLFVQLLRKDGDAPGVLMEQLVENDDTLKQYVSFMRGGVLAELRDSEVSLQDWSTVAYWAKQLGVSLAGVANNMGLEQAYVNKLENQLKQIDNKKAENTCSWPHPNRPASALFVRMSNSPLAALWRECNALQHMGIFSNPNPLADLWPSPDERNVAEYVIKQLALPGDDNFHLRFSQQTIVKEHATRFFECPTLHYDILRTRKVAPEVMHIADRCSPNRSELDRYLHQVRQAYPDVWKLLLHRIDSWRDHSSAARFVHRDLEELAVEATSRRLLRGVSHIDTYHAAQWLGCQFIGLPEQRGGYRTPILPSPLPWIQKLHDALQHGESELERFISRGQYYDDSGTEVLQRTPTRAKAAMIAIAALAYKTERSAIARAAGDWPSSPLLNVLLDTASHDDGSKRIRQLWQWVNSYSAKVPFQPIFERAKKWVDAYTQSTRLKFTTPYSRYLLSERAPIRPSAPSGDFDELREYTHGDDVNKIDWTASARSDRLYVKKFREREFRPVALLVDGEWLYDNLTTSGEQSTTLNKDRVQQIYTHILLAEKEGVPFDLYILTRAHTKKFEGLHSSREHHKDNFHHDFSCLVDQFRASYQSEATLYRGQDRPGYPLLDTQIQIPRGSLVLCAFAPHNRRTALGTLNALKRQGSFVHILKRR